jgi:acetylornithine deacetylase/succinyl-diaminopimelate desuccinylase-like protein
MLNAYINENKQRFLEELFEILRIPSVSADAKYDADVKKTAEFVKTSLIKIGLDKAEVIATKGHPVVYAEKIIDPILPTVLIYGHYDVQPADPLDLWNTAPFEPVIKKTEIHPEGAIFARGACDDKGQMFMHVKAVEAMLKTTGLPCNVKFMIEGEEEVGSENLEAFIKANKGKLSADVILVSDTGMLSNETPSVTVGLRGLSYFEVEVIGPNRDLHSGLYGGAVANPCNVLCDMISSLHDADRKITIPGFYDDVFELSKEERAEMAKAPFSEEKYCKALNIPATVGEKGYSTMERATIRPTLDVNGMWGGYTGVGAKTVIPSAAYAKISMRLVPNQDPNKITQLFQKHFESIAPAGVRVVVKPHHAGQPAMTPTDSIEFKLQAWPLKKVLEKNQFQFAAVDPFQLLPCLNKCWGLKQFYWDLV